LSWNCRQIRPTVDFDRPLWSAIDFRDQWVAFFGSCSNVEIQRASSVVAAIKGRREPDEHTALGGKSGTG
jgi:hypothetical protein